MLHSIYAVFLWAIVLSVTIDIVETKYVYRPEIQRWVSQKKIVATWQNAKQKCKKEDAIFASPIDAEILKIMKSYIEANNYSTPYFLGFKAIHHVDGDVQFLSVEGVDFYDMPDTALDMIEKIDPFEGECLSMDSQNIRAVSCELRLPYICYTNVTANGTTNITSTTKEVERSSCGTGYTLYPTGCYKAHYVNQSFRNAKRTCEGEGGYLVVLNDAEEANIVKDLHSQPPLNVSKWIGLEDQSQMGDWRSIKGNHLVNIYSKWADSTFTQHCGVIQTDGLINDFKCGNKIPFICEKDQQSS
ncbi:unnamed protein product [Arctia plantaginis]|uniref:C-type lectin domain-containing protein n=1 Tax=Arctia plantaginis TaxID=874455 RepID=A0A8S1AGH3_ARCPL|nr:unnamed protein product [Arctia plantaginis]